MITIPVALIVSLIPLANIRMVVNEHIRSFVCSMSGRLRRYRRWFNRKRGMLLPLFTLIGRRLERRI